MLQAARGGTGYKAPGTQSAAATLEVKNDYCQQFVDTGHRPQNYLRDSLLTDRWAGDEWIPALFHCIMSY
jgi:hypothetical protein